MTNVHEYFIAKLGRDPHDETLLKLPINSGCGRDCKKSIDMYAALIAHVDPHPEVAVPLILSARNQISILWHG